jgi:hypothetical protein
MLPLKKQIKPGFILNGIMISCMKAAVNELIKKLANQPYCVLCKVGCN